MILHRAAVLATTVQETCPAWPLAPSLLCQRSTSEEINKKYEEKKNNSQPGDEKTSEQQGGCIGKGK